MIITSISYTYIVTSNLETVPLLLKFPIAKIKVTINSLKGERSYQNIKKEDSRVLEVKAAFKNIKITDIILGRGMGAQYIYVERNGSINIKKNLHISPLSFIYKNGIFLTLLIYFYIINLIYKSKKIKQTITRSAFLYSVAAVFDSLTVFLFFFDPFLILSLNILRGNIRKKQKNKMVKDDNRRMIE